MPEFAVGRFVFPSKKAAQDHDKKIRSAPPRVLEGEQFEFARALLDRHPSVKKKVGSGVAAIEVVPDKQYFRYDIVHTDGTRIDFSNKRCFSGKRETARARASRAFRQKIEPQMVEARDRLFALGAPSVTSAASGVALTRSTAHMDHHPVSFKTFMETFCSLEGICVAKVEVRDGVEAGHIVFVDEALGERWFAYHQEHVRLRPVTIKENLSKSREDDSKEAREHTVLETFRAQVRSQMEHETHLLFSTDQPPVSAVSGEELTEDTFRWDYWPRSFHQVVTDFCAVAGASVEEVALRGGEFADMLFGARWEQYHRFCAQIRPVTSTEYGHPAAGFADGEGDPAAEEAVERSQAERQDPRHLDLI